MRPLTRSHRREHVAWCFLLTIPLAGCGFGAGQTCGGIAGTSCLPGLFCKFDVGVCGEDDPTGVCESRPQACTLEFAPVCGCDGETYGNECIAAAAGASVDHIGECSDDGQICGGIVPLVCDEDSYCRFEVGVCGEGDQSGVCEQRPQVCPEIFAPVCGCDGMTYENECSAASAGVSIDSEGVCP